jgi:6,7-dimethyl-8-ribityllumazine synthase
MLSASEIRIGVVVSRNDYRRIMDIAPEIYAPLLRRGCRESNITLKYVPSDFHLALGTLFFAEYTDVDGVIVVGEEFDTNIAKSLHELQIQWNMPIEYRYNGSKTGDDCGLVDMIQLQSEMAGELPEEKSPASRRENIN